VGAGAGGIDCRPILKEKVRAEVSRVVGVYTQLYLTVHRQVWHCCCCCHALH
jgi:hypothetical protein